ncbi:hypothetical protein HU830_01575 [Lactobacillus sp. DCY120]|uniref:Uncharacterized protein n=1 Tax=Bombilactobacillus apium TaxID=2675299 RepID=A0A850R0L2_9LACO|nr:hypothetical protein [Bombilactobacillus apium]NVY95890.1 hypothetical protein [Bombilactobacillus apium]
MIQVKEIIEGKTWKKISKDVCELYGFLKSNRNKTEIMLTTTSAKNMITCVFATWLSGKTFSFYTGKQLKVRKNTIVITDELLKK